MKYDSTTRYYGNGGSGSNNNRSSSRNDYSRQASGRSINFNDHHHGDSVEGSVMMDQNGQILVRDTNNYRTHHHQQQQQSQMTAVNNENNSNMMNGYDGGGGGGGVEDMATTKSQQQQQQIQVQILPQDDNWGENTTAFTADFSDFNDDMTEDGRSSHYNPKNGMGDNCSYNKDDFLSGNKKSSATKNCTKKLYGLLNLYLTKYFGFICAICVSVSAFITPILFVTLPRLNLDQQWQLTECGLECEGQLIGMAFKLFILLIGAWAIFARRPKAILPRIYELRALLLFILCLMTFSFWLFYGVRIIDAHTQDYYKILQFTDSYVDVLLFVFIVSVFILELRHLQPQYVVKIMRSPDGEQRQYTIGKMSIQRAAIWLLEQYYKDFGVYNPWLESAHRKRLNNVNQQMQIEHDGGGGGGKKVTTSRSKMSSHSSSRMNGGASAGAGAAAASGGLNFNASERFYEEYDYERRLKKRKIRLITSTEEAFTHIRRMQFDDAAAAAESSAMNSSNNNNNNTGSSSPTLMDPYEAAQAIFTSIARDLRRYLRVTRQQPYFTRDSIIAHLANCISYDMSPKSFLQRYLVPEPLVFNERALVSASSEQQAKLSGVLPHGSNHIGVKYQLNF